MGSVAAFLAVRAVPGVEVVDGTTYRRALGGRVVEADLAALAARTSSSPGGPASSPSARPASPLAAVLGPDPAPGLAALAADPHLGPVVAAAPGVRVPGTVDGGETAVRAVLGQQVSVAAARTLAGRLAAALGAPVDRPRGGVVVGFPAPAALAEAPDELLAMPRSRQRAVRALAAALASGLDPGDRAALLELPGIGPWTADYVAIRLGAPDVLLAGDLGVRHGARRLGLPDDARGLAAWGERWAPHRSLATVLLWEALAP